jgi:hypothetical protein
MALGWLGLGDTRKAEKLIEKLTEMDVYHQKII